MGVVRKLHVSRPRLLPYTLRHTPAIAFGTFSAGMTAACHLLLPKILQRAIDYLADPSPRIGPGAGFYACVFLAVAGVGGLFRFLSRRLMFTIEQEIEYELRSRLFRHLLLLPQSFYDRCQTGDLMSRAINDIRAIATMLGRAVMYLAFTIPVFIVALLLMLQMDVRLTVIVIAPLAALSLLVKGFHKATEPRAAAVQNQLGALSALVHEGIFAVRLIRAYAGEVTEVNRFVASNDEYVRLNRKLVSIQGLVEPVIALVVGLDLLLVLWGGSRAVVQGRMTVGELVAFNGYVIATVWPVIAFGSMTGIIQRGRASWNRVRNVLEEQP